MALPTTASNTTTKPTDYARLALLGILALALLLRLYGIGWALPTATRLFSYHPDESMVLGAVLQLDPLHFKFDPGFYNYGSLSLLLDSWAIMFGHLLGTVSSSANAGLPSASELLAARMVTAFLGAFTCGFIYGAGRIAYDRRAGIVAALLYAIAPLAVQHGHWATVDVPATFWISGALYFAIRAASASESKRFDLLWCGVFAGLAAATKYNGGLVLLAGLMAVWVRRELRTPAQIGQLLAATIVAFVVGCPTIVLNPKGLIGGVLYEANHVSHGQDEPYKGTTTGFIYHLGVSLNWGLTLPLLAIALVGVVWALRQQRPGDLILLAFTLPYYVLIGMAQLKFARYTLPLLPPFLLFVGALLSSVVVAQRRSVTLVASVALTAAGVWALLLAVALDQTMTLPDTRDRAAAFIRQSLLGNVGFPTGPWWYSPPLEPLTTAPIPAAAKSSAADATNPRLLPADPDWNADWSTESVKVTPPDAVAISEYEYADALRLQRPDALSFLARVARDYPHRTVFAQPIEVLGIRFTNPDSTGDALPRQGLPHDMLYTNPTTVVYTR